MKPPLLMGIAGRSGMGKTTLIERLIPALAALGKTVSTIKHAHHGFDLDRPGKDSFRHREAGAREIMLATGSRWALMHEQQSTQEEPDIDSLAGRMEPVDIILVEGFGARLPVALEVWRREVGKPPLWPEHPAVRAVALGDACDALADLPPSLVTFRLSDVGEIASWVVDNARSAVRRAAGE
ncbi:molybdopterin-guanine dinucleotide biosynthesis protein B [Acetobacter sp. DsW_063]|uniref:molybdopterin-guanine dinucleotide biosynthesis protein B n=1 Tax=Acetobacter sp. DsW_063 TaxID=1514894 RepID=UPI000A3D2570|nr:molybdopterin-guanine dinucleotide biosynthesis protein B [Acetobacter sp. DsW_063]OUJ15507.1 hypothetical protein HK28_07575 [Acetobacter sp. DsW_063]